MTLTAPIFYNGLDANGQPVTSIPTPVNPTDAVNKAYSDSQAAGGQWHPSVRVAMISNVTITAPGATLDGVTLSAGDRILLTGQTTASQNGPWIWNGAAVSATRPTDWVAASVRTNIAAFFPVDEGTHNGSTDGGPIWYLTTDGAITIDTTATAWSSMSIGITYSASSTGGLSLTSGVFSVKLPGTPGLVADSTGLYITKASAQAVGLTAKYSGTSPALSAGVASANINHGLGTTAVQIQLKVTSTGVMVVPGSVGETIVDANNITLQSATAVSSGFFTVVVIG